jgi:hypothetical protein
VDPLGKTLGFDRAAPGAFLTRLSRVYRDGPLTGTLHLKPATVGHLVVEGLQFPPDALAFLDRYCSPRSDKMRTGLLGLKLDPQVGLSLFHKQEWPERLKRCKSKRIPEPQPVNSLVPIPSIAHLANRSAEKSLGDHKGL